MTASETRSLDARFAAFDAEHPEIYAEFKRRAEDLLNAGRKHYGAKSLMEAIRYHTALRGSPEIKINNNYTSRYARKLMHEDSRFSAFFQTRKLLEKRHLK